MKRVVVIGGGVGGLATAALLAREGVDVTVLEAHDALGGCAATFDRGGYRFDAGATLALGFDLGGPWDLLAKALALPPWPVIAGEPALLVHLPDGRAVARIAGEARWSVREEHFGLGPSPPGRPTEPPPLRRHSTPDLRPGARLRRNQRPLRGLCPGPPAPRPGPRPRGRGVHRGSPRPRRGGPGGTVLRSRAVDRVGIERVGSRPAKA